MTSCKEVIREIQTVFDSNGSLSKSADEHIVQCEKCAQVYRDYRRSVEAWAHRVDGTIESMGEPDLTFLEEEHSATGPYPKTTAQRLVSYLPRAAALVAIVLVPFGIYLGYNSLRDRSLIRDDASTFIDSLYDGAYFPSSSLTDDLSTADALFTGTEAVAEFDIPLSRD